MSTQKQSMVRDLTGGNVTQLLLSFAFPLFVSNALQAVYNIVDMIVDMIVVGQFIGGTGMSAVSIGGDVLHLLTFVAMGFSSAGQVLVARDVGAGRMEDVRHTIGTMFTFLLGVALLVNRLLLGGAMHTGALVLMFILPPPYVLPVFADAGDERANISSALSVLTLLSIILSSASV